MKWLSSYTLFARFMPTFLISLPLIIFMFFINAACDVSKLAKHILAINICGVSSYIIFIYFMSHIIRSTSKYYENKQFINNKGFPTTYFMTYADSKYSEEFKSKYRQKVHNLFSFSLLNKEEETSNFIEAVKRLNEATRLVISHVGDGKLVLQYNTWYGFIRNLIGGLVYSIVLCAINVILSRTVVVDNVFFYVSMILAIIYVLIFLFKTVLLKQYAETYADKLISEFMTSTAKVKNDKKPKTRTNLDRQGYTAKAGAKDFD